MVRQDVDELQIDALDAAVSTIRRVERLEAVSSSDSDTRSKVKHSSVEVFCDHSLMMCVPPQGCSDCSDAFQQIAEFEVFALIFTVCPGE